MNENHWIVIRLNSCSGRAHHQCELLREFIATLLERLQKFGSGLFERRARLLLPLEQRSVLVRLLSNLDLRDGFQEKLGFRLLVDDVSRSLGRSLEILLVLISFLDDLDQLGVEVLTLLLRLGGESRNGRQVQGLSVVDVHAGVGEDVTEVVQEIADHRRLGLLLRSGGCRSEC